MRFGQGGVGLMGTTEVSVDGVVPSTLVGVDAGGCFPFSTTAFGIQNVTAGAILQSVNYSTDALTTLDAAGANRSSGGNDVWARYLASGPSAGVETNVGGLGPFPLGALGDVSEDGQLVLIQDASGTGLATYSDAGVLQYSIQATLTGFSTVRARQGYFAYPADPGWWLRDLVTGAATSLAQRATVTLTIPVVINSRVYVVEYEPATGVSIRLATQSTGYVIPDTIGDSFNIDAVFLSGTTVRVGMSSGAGEAPTELRVFDVNVADGALEVGETTGGSLVFATAPSIPGNTSLPTSGFTGGSGAGTTLTTPQRQPIAQDDKRVTPVWNNYFNNLSKSANGVIDLSNGAQVTGVLQPENGGTGNTSGGGSGGGTGNVTAAAALTANALVIGQGAAAIAALGSLGTTTTVLHGNAAGAPAFGAVSLTADVTGDLPYANLAQGSALSALGVTGNATADNASIVAGTDHQVLRRSGTAVAFGAVNLAQSAAVTGVLPIANGGSPILTATPSFNDAAIKAWPTGAGLTLVAAPGAGFYINPLYVIVKANITTGYTNIHVNASINIHTADWQTDVLSYLVNGNGTGLAQVSDFLATNTQNAQWSPMPYAFGQGPHGDAFFTDWGLARNFVNIVDAENQALIMEFDNNAAGALTAGNGANTLKASVYYTIEPI